MVCYTPFERHTPGDWAHSVQVRFGKLRADYNASMGIRFYCPNGCKIHVKAFQAGKRGICPHCGCTVDIPLQSTRGSSKQKQKPRTGPPESKPPSQENLAAEKAGRSSRPHDLPGPQAQQGGSAVNAANMLEMGPLSLPMPGPQAEPTVGAREMPPAESVSPSPAHHGKSPAAVSSSLADPFEQSPHAIWYVCPPSGGQFGPATNEVMRSWLAEGRVPPESKVWRDGWSEWKTASEVFPATFFPPAMPPDVLPDMIPPIPRDDAALAPSAHSALSPERSTLAQLFILLAVLALGIGVLVAIYVWARFF